MPAPDHAHRHTQPAQGTLNYAHAAASPSPGLGPGHSPRADESAHGNEKAGRAGAGATVPSGEGEHAGMKAEEAQGGSGAEGRDGTEAASGDQPGHEDGHGHEHQRGYQDGPHGLHPAHDHGHVRDTATSPAHALHPHLPPSADAIDLVIASAMALANSGPHMPPLRGSVSAQGQGQGQGYGQAYGAGPGYDARAGYGQGGVGGGAIGMGGGPAMAPPMSMSMSSMSMSHPHPHPHPHPQPHPHTITPSGFHPAAVGLDGRVNLFVGNLPYRVRWQDVKDLFRRAGTVLRADVSLDVATNRSRGYGTVLMGSREDGVKAIGGWQGDRAEGEGEGADDACRTR